MSQPSRERSVVTTAVVVGNPKPGSRTLVVDAAHDDPAAYADWLAASRPVVSALLAARTGASA